MSADTSGPQPIVLFVCQHGSAKSVIAAALLQQLATEHGVALDARSAGIEPHDEVPSHVINGLRSEGIDVAPLRPQLLTREVLSNAQYVVSFGCDLGARNPAKEVQWSDVPAVSDGYASARAAIAARVRALFDEIRAAS